MKVHKRTWKNKDGKKQSSWFVYFIDPATGKRVRKVLKDETGLRPVSSERAAWTAALKLYGEQAKDPTHRAMETAPDGVTMTLGELLAQHRNRTGIQPITREIEKHQGSKLTEKLGENTALSRVCLDDLDVYVAARLEDTISKYSKKKVSGATVVKELKLLNQALRWAAARGKAVRPPFEKLPAVRYEEYQPRCLTFDELKALLKACGPDTAPLRQMAEFKYLTGLRRSELFRLTWANVDFNRKMLRFITMKGGKADTRREDVVYLPERAIKLLKLRWKHFTDEPEETDLIFGVAPYLLNDVETTVDPHFADALASAARRAGLPRPNEVGPHTLRHTCATHLLKNGATVPEAAKHLRHRDGGALLLRKYGHAHEEGLRTAAAALAGEKYSPDGKKTKSKLPQNSTKTARTRAKRS